MLSRVLLWRLSTSALVGRRSSANLIFKAALSLLLFFKRQNNYRCRYRRLTSAETQRGSCESAKLDDWGVFLFLWFTLDLISDLFNFNFSSLFIHFFCSFERWQILFNQTFCALFLFSIQFQFYRAYTQFQIYVLASFIFFNIILFKFTRFLSNDSFFIFCLIFFIHSFWILDFFYVWFYSF